MFNNYKNKEKKRIINLDSFINKNLNLEQIKKSQTTFKGSSNNRNPRYLMYRIQFCQVLVYIMLYVLTHWENRYKYLNKNNHNYLNMLIILNNAGKINN